ncbi:MAG TPA: hypothetical protein VFQ91_00705 [Bryobacteraceae bacterium]|nr:hypothetical protein [Bryobacteraceae bacterium]
MFHQNLDLNSHLAATVTRKDGSHRDIETLSTDRINWKAAISKIKEPMKFWERAFFTARQHNLIPIGLTVAGFAAAVLSGDATPAQMALVTTAGVGVLAADFVSGAGTRINAFNYHAAGTGTTSATTSDTTLQTDSGVSRVSGTQSNPSSGTYRSVATLNFSSTLAITEWGLFSASTSGILWDRRVFSAINVASGDSIQFTYSLTVPAGGS